MGIISASKNANESDPRRLRDAPPQDRYVTFDVCDCSTFACVNYIERIYGNLIESLDFKIDIK